MGLETYLLLLFLPKFLLLNYPLKAPALSFFKHTHKPLPFLQRKIWSLSPEEDEMADTITFQNWIHNGNRNWFMAVSSVITNYFKRKITACKNSHKTSQRRESVYLDIFSPMRTAFQGEASQNLHIWVNASHAGWPPPASTLPAHPQIPLTPTLLALQPFGKYILTAQLKSSRKDREKSTQQPLALTWLSAMWLLMLQGQQWVMPPAGWVVPKTASLPFSASREPPLSSSKKTRG